MSFSTKQPNFFVVVATPVVVSNVVVATLSVVAGVVTPATVVVVTVALFLSKIIFKLNLNHRKLFNNVCLRSSRCCC